MSGEITPGPLGATDPLRQAKGVKERATAGEGASFSPCADTRAFDPILTIHSGDDGYIALCRKRGEEFDHLAAIPGSELADALPQLRDELLYDSFYSINSFWRAEGICSFNARWKQLTRRTETLRRLCACFVDLDIYNAGIRLSYALEEIRRLQERRVIPPPTYIVSSGRGVWLFWQLRDLKQNDRPQRAWPEKVKWYERIQRALCERLVHLSPDASDAARITRVHGSVNPKSGERVSYHANVGADGQIPVYTLADLGLLLNVPENEPSRPRRVSKRDKKNEGQRKGYRAFHQRRITNIEKLNVMRGGFHEGCRNYVILIYATTLRGIGRPDPEIDDRVYALATSFQPSLSRQEIGGTLKSVRRRTGRLKFGNQKIADWLDVTPKEADALPGWCCAKRHRVTMLMPLSREQRTLARRALIQKIVADRGGSVPSTRKMQGMIESFGHHACNATISKDYKALSLGERSALREPETARAA